MLVSHIQYGWRRDLKPLFPRDTRFIVHCMECKLRLSMLCLERRKKMDTKKGIKKMVFP